MFSSVKTARSLLRERKFEKRAVVGVHTSVFFYCYISLKKRQKTHNPYEKIHVGYPRIMNSNFFRLCAIEMVRIANCDIKTSKLDRRSYIIIIIYKNCVKLIKLLRISSAL